MSGGGNWMFDLVEESAQNNDIDALVRFQNRSIGEDEAIVRLQKAVPEWLRWHYEVCGRQLLKKQRKCLLSQVEMTMKQG